MVAGSPSCIVAVIDSNAISEALDAPLIELIPQADANAV